MIAQTCPWSESRLLSGRFPVTTLFAFLVTFDLELNPEPTSPSGQASTDSPFDSDNSRPTEKCTTDQSTTMQQILQSMQSLSSSIN